MACWISSEGRNATNATDEEILTTIGGCMFRDRTTRTPAVLTAAAGGHPMEVIFFEATVVALNRGGHLLIALFDGAAQDRCVGIWRCETAAAEALLAAISSAINSKADEK